MPLRQFPVGYLEKNEPMKQPMAAGGSVAQRTVRNLVHWANA